MTLSPRESGEFISKNAKHVKISYDGIKKIKSEFLQVVKSKDDSLEDSSQGDFHPKPEQEDAIEHIFIIDTLNFCFWSKEGCPKWTVENQTGYFALCAAIKRALSEGFKLTNPEIYKNITEIQLKHIFRGDNESIDIPLLKERVKCLQEVGTKLTQKFGGKFENCIKQCNNSAQKLLHLIITEFECFRDEAVYNGQRVSFYKRAQILIGDIWCLYKGKNLGQFDDINSITMFADYRIPQVLLHFGAIIYDDELNNLLNSQTILKNGSVYENEIRGVSIFVIEEIKKLLFEEIDNGILKIPKTLINSIVIDHFLWGYRRKNEKNLECVPFHKVLCIYY